MILNYNFFRNATICFLSVLIISAKPSRSFIKSKKFLVKEIQTYAENQQTKHKSTFWQKKSNQTFSKNLDEYFNSFPFENKVCNDITFIAQLNPENCSLSEQLLSECIGWDEMLNSLIEESGIEFSEFYPTHIRLTKEKKSRLFEKKKYFIKQAVETLKKDSEDLFKQYLNEQLENIAEFAGKIESFHEFIHFIFNNDIEFLRLEDTEQLEQYLANRNIKILCERKKIAVSIWQNLISNYQQKSSAYLFNFENNEEKFKKLFLPQIRSRLSMIVDDLLDPSRIPLIEKVAELHKATDYRLVTAYLNRELNVNKNYVEDFIHNEIMASTNCFRCDDSLSETKSTILYPFRCSHSLCNECLQDLIQLNQSEMEPLTCPIPNCSESAKLDDLLTNKIISVLLHARFNFFQARKIASLSADWTPCKKADCDGGRIKPRQMDETRYTCELCNHNQCINCKEDHNKFISCDEYREIQSHAHDPLYLSKKKNLVKNCPNSNCKVPISKADGCLHMTCNNCKHEFNWETLKPWQGTAYYRLENGTNIDSRIDSGRENTQVYK
ncbi:MAG: IBR domain-containing protein [Oligoflexales bacterium]